MPEYTSKEQLYDALNKMVALLQADDAYKQRISRADLTVAFTITDLSAEYTLKIVKGTLEGAVGTADGATFGAIMSSATLDKLLSGRLDGESAYEMGAIRIRGSEWVAESAAGYVYSMVNAYKRATGQA
ncbi:MAG: SCP2 sterol-binding domain-containing protein [Chloroflexi bacterium]|nr:SCP2 sterol-binding domain-containing protein [Chloroflexota bacterium]